MTLVKAKIAVLDRDKGKLNIPNSFEVMFNPTELTLSKGAQIAEVAIPGLDTPVLQYVRGQNEKLTLDLYFDSTHSGMDERATDISEITNQFYQLVKIQSKTHALPRIRFEWGKFSFAAVVENIQRKFSLFSPDGRPLRATLSVTFREYKTIEEQLAEFNLQSPDHSRRYVTRLGDTLDRIAAIEYGDTRKWRVIAEENGLRDARDFQPGTVLLLPPIDRATRVGA